MLRSQEKTTCIQLPRQNKILIETLYEQKFDMKNLFKQIFKEFIVMKTKILLMMKLRNKLAFFNSRFINKIDFNSQPILIEPYPYCFID